VSKPYNTVLNFTHFTKLHLTPPHYTNINFTSHPVLIPFPSPRLADLHPTLCPFTSIHLSISKSFSWKYSISSLLQNPFISLHLLHFSPFSWKYSISSSLRIPFTSLHCISLITFPNPLPKGARFGGVSP
jgi:hypothetical protein